MRQMIKSKTGVHKTETVKKVSFGGELQEYSVYRVNINYLYFNDRNDRIATWMSKYIEEHGELVSEDVNKYNDVIEEFIVNSNKERYIKTKANIKGIGQREPGVILNDGRVIDGNRRFTCLRQLFNETEEQKFEYFETIIVDGDVDDKEIKILELDLQHGVDEKVDYNPIDKLVGIYNDVIKKKVLSQNEYQGHINATNSQMKLMIEKALIMVDFLEFMKAKEKFYIARDLDLDGPLQEIASIKKRYKKNEWEEIKLTLYSYMVAKPKGDITRAIRDIGSILKSKKAEEFLEKTESKVARIHDAIPENVISAQSINVGLSNEKTIIIEMGNDIETYRVVAGIESIKQKPIQTIIKAIGVLEDVDVDIVERLSVNDKKSIKEELNRLGIQIHKINEVLNVN